MKANYRLIAYFIAIALNGAASVYFFRIRDRLAYSLAFVFLTICLTSFTLALLLSQEVGLGNVNVEFRKLLMTVLATLFVAAPTWTLCEFQRRRNNNA
jgi:hypothetical protein